MRLGTERGQRRAGKEGGRKVSVFDVESHYRKTRKGIALLVVPQNTKGVGGESR